MKHLPTIIVLLTVLGMPIGAWPQDSAQGTESDPPADDPKDPGGAGDKQPTPSTPVARECDRDLEADLLTIEDRLTKGRLDAARAYIEGLVQCLDGREDPRVMLALAVVEEREGRLNESYRAIELATAMALNAGLELEPYETLAADFQTRWVALDLVAAPGVTGRPNVEHDGLVAEEATLLCLQEARDFIENSTDDAFPTTLWLVPGVYRIEGERVRLPPGTRRELPVVDLPLIEPEGTAPENSP